MSYRELASYKQAAIIYDFTVEFCKKYIDRMSRTTDQMVQAARSGKQNIVEGSSEKTSEKSELKLLGVARASFQELLEDYEDFLRQRSLRQWEKDSAQARAVRELAYRTNRSYLTYKSFMSNPEFAANAAICLINQANYLLDKQIKSAEEKFIKTGGYAENLRRKRENSRKNEIINSFNRKYFG
jgi:restriction system protein